jgi:TIGR03009 family protein
MSARILPLTALSVILLVLFGAVVASAQAPVEQQPAPGAAPLPLQQPAPTPQAPFTLSQQEEASLDRLLIDWQNMSGNVKTFAAKFNRFDYDGVFGKADTPKRVVEGSLKYAAPDKGFYELNDQSEKWICTGDTIFEFRADQKQVREHPLPPNMRGKAISDGPMPFVFGVEAGKMKARYWLRIVTFPNQQPNQVGLEAFPRHAKDAANFTKVDIILTFEHNNGTVTKLEPYAINLILPNGKDRTAYQFTEMTTNGFLDGVGNTLNIFVRPAIPFGWQHQVMDDDGPAGPEAPQPSQPAAGIGSAPQTTVPR